MGTVPYRTLPVLVLKKEAQTKDQIQLVLH
jgi:hypothetical protein